ncbi:sialate O-acetylesterase [Pedobacter sp. SYSU D00535]|uniref:sialate O-acetylesterase n=1 Tax=Pedobacter sp. SYSU D00535 TaxID=2810308 RepID=UPI001A96D942|nr:sialate O-acetylesterase [Pedobacter sp. SYSU D00535]
MNQFKPALVTFFFLFFLLHDSVAQIRLPALIRDSMVLQRNSPLKIWGWASPNEKIKIRFNGKSVNITAGPDGKWLAKLPAMKAGGPYQMRLQGKNEILLRDILIGDVWLCSGQSNMVHQMGIHNVTYAEDIAKANYPQIRQFWVPTATSLTGPKSDLKGGAWKWANPKDVNDFSAVAYFFARDIHTRHRVPIGIINASVGGTPIEAWTSEEGLKEFPAVLTLIKKNKDTAYVNSMNRRPPPAPARPGDVDKGLTGAVKWFDPAYTPKNWRSFTLPGYWEDQGIRDMNGVVWFRKEIYLPESLAGKAAKLFMGRIVDADIAYINGKQVGLTTYMYPQRRYSVPAGILKAGKNLLVVRVQNNSGKGGFVPDKPYYLQVGDEVVDLKGDWQYKVAQVFRPVEGRGGSGGISEQNQPTALYNAMVAPFRDYALKGVLWYQGESNAGRAQEYEKLLPALISDWRTKFSRPDLPFYYVQLPNFGDATYLPTESGWAVMREAALKTLSVPNTGMAVAIDLGEWNDIHPDNKKDVGERLALIARRFNYGEKTLVYSGPLYQSSRIVANKILLSFSNLAGGLISIDGEELTPFEIAGADKKFVTAQARIVGGEVEVWSEEIPEPKYVRYAWADNPVGPNLYNAEKLPASPFRTDK